MIELARKKASWSDKLFILWVVLYQITYMYKMPFFSAITVGDFGFLIILPVLLIKGEKRNKVFTLVLLMLILTIPFLLSMLNNLGAFMRMIRFVFSMVIVAFFVPNFFHRDIVLPMLTKIAVIIALFIMLQFLLATFLNFYLNGTISFLEATYSSIEVLFNSQGNITDIRRFRGFFSEPAALSTFLAVALICALSENKHDSGRSYFPEVLMTIGMIVSQSTTGLGLLVIIWGYWIISSGRKKWMFLLLTIPLFLLIEKQFGFLGNTFSRGINTSSSMWQVGQATIGRIGNFTSVFNASKLTATQILFGQGMDELAVFIPGWGRCFIYFGITGMSIFIIIYLSLFFKTKGYARVLTVCLIVMNFFGDMLFGVTPLFVLPFIFVLSKEKTERMFCLLLR